MEEDDNEKDEGKENSYHSGKGVEDDYARSDDEYDETCFGSQLKSPTYETLGRVSARQVQLQKASFFGGLMDDDDEEDLEAVKRKAKVVRESIFKGVFDVSSHEICTSIGLL